MRIRIQVWGMLLCLLTVMQNHAQSKTDTAGFSVSVFNEQGEALAGAIVEIQQGADNTLVKSAVTNKNGLSVFYIPVTAGFLANISFIGYQPVKVPILPKNISDKFLRIVLTQTAKDLANVTVNSRKPFLQQAQGKIIVNVEASVTNAGTTILEVMEKLPGVVVDKNGGISLQGKTGVLVLIDDKPTYVSGSDLNNLLSGMSSAQVDQIELITSPSAKYDASGNAGIINIKTKKNKQVGFNGILSTAFTQGRYPKSNNSLVLNYRNGRFNAFLTYSGNYNKGFTDIYALRKYYNPSRALVATLDQPTIFISRNLGHTLKTGFDFYAGPKTTLGLAFTGIWVNRETSGDAAAHWINTSGGIDSTIQTNSNSTNHFNNVGVNVNGRHSIGKQQEISFDVDLLKYSISNRQNFNSFFVSGGQQAEGSRGDLPSGIDIFSVKADHRIQISNYSKLESGYKISSIRTDNVAAYDYFDGTQWKEDLGKSNHFLYKEAIQAIYSSMEYKKAKLSYQLGLRFENTNYDAHQLGNSARNDSAFSNHYSGFFPSGYLSYEADSSNIFTVTAGRRIDRPPFQRLNPFVLIINKYTYERGNPFFKPQYSWNLELSHQFKQFLTTTLSYSIIKDYFSQLFLAEGTDILVYTNGNVGKMVNLGLSVAVQLSPAKWWSLNSQAVFNYKKFSGYQNVNYQSNISQLTTSINNQFRLDKNYTAEISGFYTGKARNDIQERLLPTGQLSIGIARPVLQKKGTLKLSMRDIFFTQVMEGNTDFPNADEYFILRRDTRVINIAFTWRLGKPLKTQHRSTGGAKDEIDRVNGG
ncbi:MAG: TonB-dependent receptor [Bacteroidota bacterium]|nr:TonB-dependent receptor [Bacteroidota bacterium]